MEFVYVVPRRDLFADCYPQGFAPFGEECAQQDFEETVARRGFFVERERAETNPDWKQIIPYTIVVRTAPSSEATEVLLLRRLSKGGESRLVGKLSIGVGGHLNPEDLGSVADRRSVLECGTQREITEELAVEGSPSLRRVGLLNDDSNAVGAVHLGLVQVATVTGSVAIRETDVLEGDFESPSRLRDLLEEGAPFETWSEKLLRHLDRLIPVTREQAGVLFQDLPGTRTTSQTHA